MLSLIALQFGPGKVSSRHLLLFLGSVVQSCIQRYLSRLHTGPRRGLPRSCIHVVKHKQHFADRDFVARHDVDGLYGGGNGAVEAVVNVWFHAPVGADRVAQLFMAYIRNSHAELIAEQISCHEENDDKDNGETHPQQETRPLRSIFVFCHLANQGQYIRLAKLGLRSKKCDGRVTQQVPGSRYNNTMASETSNAPRYTDQHAKAGLDFKFPAIETWQNQFPGYEILIDDPELTSVCPKTGLPDFGVLTIRYMPRERCLELKSLKEYLFCYRNLGIFQENIVNQVLEDVVKACDPVWAEVKGVFRPRGGIGTTVEARWPRPKE